jgi:hypothetical protein
MPVLHLIAGPNGADKAVQTGGPLRVGTLGRNRHLARVGASGTQQLTLVGELFAGSVA